MTHAHFFFLVFDLLLGVTPFLVSNDTDEFFFLVSDRRMTADSAVLDALLLADCHYLIGVFPPMFFCFPMFFHF